MGTPEELRPARLGAAAVTFFALAAAAPLTVLIIVVPAGYARGGGVLVPLAFVVIAIVLLLFAATYAAMAHRAPVAGAMYTYVSRGLGRPAGTAAAAVALVSYHALQLGLYGVAGLAAAPLLHDWFHVDVAWWTVAVACWLLVVPAGLLRVEVAGGLFALVVLAEIAVIAGFTAVNLLEPAGRGLTEILPAGPAAVDRPALGLLLPVVVLAVVGFETAGAYAEETMHPRRDAGRAAYAIVLVLSLLAVAAWSVSAAAGGEVTALARQHGPDLVFDLAAARLPSWAVTLGRVLLLTGLLAAQLALHHAIARYLFALGRERLLAAGLARTSRRGVPWVASITQSVLAGLALLAAVLTGPDAPERLAAAGGLGILALLTATALAALLHLNRLPDAEGSWRRFLAPILSTVSLGTLCLLAFGHLPELLGMPSGSSLIWLVPVTVALVAAVGGGYGAALRGIRPAIYAGIGRGGAPVASTPTVPHPRQPGAHRPERVDR